MKDGTEIAHKWLIFRLKNKQAPIIFAPLKVTFLGPILHADFGQIGNYHSNSFLTEIALTLENFNTLVFDRHTLAKWLHMVQVLSPFSMYLP